MKKLIVVALMCCVCSAFAQDTAPTTQKTESEWCTIEVPSTTKIGGVVTAKITLKEIAAGPKLRGDLHGLSLSGVYMGMIQYGGKAQDVVSGQTVEIPIAVPFKERVTTVNVAVYLSPDGVWVNKVGDAANSAKIPLVE